MNPAEKHLAIRTEDHLLEYADFEGVIPDGQCGGGDKIPGELEKKITADLGSVAKMKEEFIQAGITQFGSGWCWLAVEDGKIVVMKTLNGENPLAHGGKPILGCDVWEHSYYIDYRNRRPDYLKAFVDHLVNWEYVAEMYREAAK
jgi:superoxide dismutase, Fe-Mn family